MVNPERYFKSVASFCESKYFLLVAFPSFSDLHPAQPTNGKLPRFLRSAFGKASTANSHSCPAALKTAEVPVSNIVTNNSLVTKQFKERQ